MDNRALAAYIFHCQAKDLLGLAQIDDNHFKVVGPNGAVHYLSQDDLHRAALKIASFTIARVIQTAPDPVKKPSRPSRLRGKKSSNP